MDHPAAGSPDEHRIIFGIDYGTTCTVASVSTTDSKACLGDIRVLERWADAKQKVLSAYTDRGNSVDGNKSKEFIPKDAVSEWMDSIFENKGLDLVNMENTWWANGGHEELSAYTTSIPERDDDLSGNDRPCKPPFRSRNCPRWPFTPKRLRTFLILLAVAGNSEMHLWKWLNPTTGNRSLEDHIEPAIVSALQTHFPPTFLSAAASPAALMLGITTTTFSLATYHYRYARSRKHQDVLLIAVVGAAALGGKAVAGLENMAILLQVVPWCVLAALLVGSWCLDADGEEPVGGVCRIGNGGSYDCSRGSDCRVEKA